MLCNCEVLYSVPHMIESIYADVQYTHIPTPLLKVGNIELSPRGEVQHTFPSRQNLTC